MPRNNELGGVRRSQVLTTFGPGAIVDFRIATGAAVSVVAAGLEEWDNEAAPKGMLNRQRIHEPRLQKELGVLGFRLPPVCDPRKARKGIAGPRLTGVRFPGWLQCPSCHELRAAIEWSSGAAGDPSLWCAACTANQPPNQRVFVVPVRFVVACEKGHLDDFPWATWVQHAAQCTSRRRFTLRADGGSGLASLILRCKECHASRSMDGCFSKGALHKQCNGRRPWLGGPNETCDHEMRALQRGASNLYFPAVASALDIPPWSDQIHKDLGTEWERLRAVPADKRLDFIEMLQLPATLGLSAEEILVHVNKRVTLIETSTLENLRYEEYLQFVNEDAAATLDAQADFQVFHEIVPPELSPWISKVVRATRLREVRALLGFTRIHPPTNVQDTTALSAIQSSPKNWLPGIEIRGEGIFLQLNTDALKAWEIEPEVVARAARINKAYLLELQQRLGAIPENPRQITPRVILVHTFAHALMRQLGLECGYSGSALRERLYVRDGPDGMAGLLIFTGTPDSDGTLGGLARQGRPNLLVRTIEAAIANLEWCSSDPLCAEGVHSLSEPTNAAACHSCMLLPETACEEFNRFLDRTSLVGLSRQRAPGFFAGLGQ
ncbi:MAG: DUF1998 domain-containing protein [Myxococcota bacterium]